jgi:UDP-GlcNAc:undecaprenyl-phosphate/decaprenyl-phosphate GlcNAc-1-phosphate transferase
MEFSKEVYIALSGLTALIIVSMSIPSIIKVAKAKNLYDYPDSRKSHARTVPTLGGLAIFAGLIVSVLIWGDFRLSEEIKYILAAIILIFFIGLKDDILVIAPNKKLIVQVLASMIMIILGDIRITNLHGFAGMHEIPYVASILVSIFVTIVVLNGMNLIDGIDGLASGIGIVTSLAFGVYFYKVGEMQYVILMSALVGSLLAFFFFNVFGEKNKIFMGDTGSLILGLVLAVFAIKFNEMNLTAQGKLHLMSAPSVSIGILMVPLFDTLRVFVIRLMKRKSPFLADNNHVHHRLLQIGCSHKKATGLIVLANILFIGTAFLLDGIGIISLLLVLTGLASLLTLIPGIILSAQKREYKEIQTIQEFAIATAELLFEDHSDQYYNNPSVQTLNQKNEDKLEKEGVKVY